VGVRALVRGQVEGGQRYPGAAGQDGAVVPPPGEDAEDVRDRLVPGIELEQQDR
jgi:hypothetical protein